MENHEKMILKVSQKTKFLPWFILIIILLLSMGSIWYLKAEVSTLKEDKINLQATLDTTKIVGDRTVQRLSIALRSEKEARNLVNSKLSEVKLEKNSIVRMYSELEIKHKSLIDSVSVGGDNIVEVDTFFNQITIQYDWVMKDREGYSIGFKPILDAPAIDSILADDYKINADLKVNFDPFKIKVVLTEEKDRHWKTTFETTSPIFNSFGSIQSFVKPKSENFFDKINLYGGLGTHFPGGIFGSIGAGYSWWSVHVQGGPGASGVLLMGKTKLSSLWGG